MTDATLTPATVELGNEYLFVKQNGAQFVSTAEEMYDGGVLAANGTWVDSNAVFETTQVNEVKQAIKDVVAKVMEVELAESKAAEAEKATKPAAPKKSETKAAKPAKAKTEPKKKTGKTKADLAAEIFERMGGVKATRKDVIAAFVDEIGLTPAGASTYAYNCKKKAQAAGA